MYPIAVHLTTASRISPLDVVVPVRLPLLPVWLDCWCGKGIMALYHDDTQTGVISFRDRASQKKLQNLFCEALMRISIFYSVQ
jgi:hypothetical protein